MDASTLIYVTGFDKTRLPHTSNSSTLIASTLTTQYAIALQVSHNAFIALCNNKSKLIANFHTELWSFKVVNLDVCGSLVLSNPVTYVVTYFILSDVPVTVSNSTALGHHVGGKFCILLC